MTSRVHDATGRPVTEGDTVGGTTSGRYQTTITGPVLQLGRGLVKVLVTNRPTVSSLRAQNGDDVWISPDRLFLIHPATERKFTGFRTPDGHTWTLARRVKGALFEAPTVPQRYEATRLRSMYDGLLTPVWEDAPAVQSPAEIRAAAFQEAAGRITNLPQDYELDPGRGDAVQLLNGLAAAAHQPDTYPPALPWARLMDGDDLADFLRDLDTALHRAVDAAVITGQPQAPAVLDALEKTCASWRVTAEAQHGHNWAPGPHAGDTSDVVAYRSPDQPDALLCRPHGDRSPDLTALTADDLPDGGLCTFGRPGEECGVDVLIPQPPLRQSAI
ncbi:hypothetical protein ACKI1J_32190 [Streptomyces scabiei]|uniref:hypothetical protein n=1 Tax=Streptomyces scabiei TaxID=1930 RepID=UPI0038F815AD